MRWDRLTLNLEKVWGKVRMRVYVGWRTLVVHNALGSSDRLYSAVGQDANENLEERFVL
jgi:hypothetical protein